MVVILSGGSFEPVDFRVIDQVSIMGASLPEAP
jgi:hypothetical protein